MKKEMTRRRMLRLSGVAGLGALFVPGRVSAGTTPVLQEDTFEIPLRTLGRTGMQLPILSMGVNRADNANVLRAAYHSGIVHFDCGHIYQNGKSEEMLGNVLGNRSRDTVNLATKAMFDYPLRDNFEEILLGQLEISLKRMKTEYVDIFYAHSISSVEKLSHPRVLALLQKIKESGKARFIGFSSHDQNNELLRAAIELGIYDVAMITYNFRIDNPEETEAVIEQAARAGMGIIAMKVMAGGTEDADGKKKIDGKACLKWVWQNPNITTVLPSVANYDELDNCLEAVREIDLTGTELAYLSAVHSREALFAGNVEPVPGPVAGDCLCRT